MGGRGSSGSGGGKGGGGSGGQVNTQAKEAYKELNTSGSVRNERITASNASDVATELAEAATLRMKIEVAQTYFGKTETTTYEYGTKFPNGLRSHSVTGWYASDWKQSYNYKTTREFANYISNINSGRGGRNIQYEVRKKKG